MRIKPLIILIFTLSPFCSFSQDVFGIPMNQRDSIFIFFLEEDGRYYSYQLGTINGNRGVDYKIKMQFGKDLCFTNSYSKPESYISQCSFEDLKEKEIKDYWYLYNNYMDEDIEELVKKLNWDSINFFLVIPDSAKGTAKVLDVFNCNNSSH